MAVFAAGNGSQRAPAQRLTDFVAGKISATLPDTSSTFRDVHADVAALFEIEASKFSKAMADFNKQMRGYLTKEPLSLPQNPVRVRRCVLPAIKIHFSIPTRPEFPLRRRRGLCRRHNERGNGRTECGAGDCTETCIIHQSYHQ